MRSLVIMVATIGFAGFTAPQAVASDAILSLSPPPTESIEQIGIVPKKVFIDLDLGGLRTDEPSLPIVSDVKSRMRKRAKRALQRQKEVARAVRPKASPSPSKDFDVVDSTSPNEPNSQGDFMAESEF